MIESELSSVKSDIQLISILGDVTNQAKLESILSEYEVNTIYHTAAYKHVPLVEKNISSAVHCNIFGTFSCYEAAVNSNVDCFVFISTDKAVRPTNFMGATKRFAEIVIQAKHSINQGSGNKSKMRASMVRFGNVLGSSGSVVPLFKKQIKSGGPVTVTDPEIVRYFMTLEEAAQLVIQAGAMGKNAEIFLLDMGDPVRILELAQNMIKLSGMTIKNSSNPDGDIEIVFTGLRPGEKLKEELLITPEADNTQHKKIMKAKDKGLDWIAVEKHLDTLSESSRNDWQDKTKEVFLKSVDGFTPQSSD